MKKGDALVYNSSGHGHTVIYEKADRHRVPRLLLRLRVQCTLLHIELQGHPPHRLLRA